MQKSLFSLCLACCLSSAALAQDLSCPPQNPPQLWLDCLQMQISRTAALAAPDLLTFLSAAAPQGQALEPPWYQVLYHPDLLPSLVPQLTSPDPAIRQHLLLLFRYALSQAPFGPELQTQVLAQLQPLHTHSDGLTRLLALELLANLAPGQVRHRLEAALQSPAPQLRVLALYHWRRLALQPAFPFDANTLMQSFSQDDEVLSELAQWHLDPVFQAAATQSFQGFLAAWLASSPTPETLLTAATVLALAQHPHPSVRQYAARRLALTGDPAYQQPLEALLQDPEAEVRAAAQAALVLLEQMIPAQYLASLKDPASLPADTAERLQVLMHHPNYRSQLMSAEFKHLRRQPAYQQAVWRLLETSQNQTELLQGLQMLPEFPPDWPPERLSPLLAASQPPIVRQQALAPLLQRPLTPENKRFLLLWSQDPDPVLPLQILAYFFQQRDSAQARQLLSELGRRQAVRVPLQDGGSETLTRYVQKRLKTWLKQTESQSSDSRELGAWLRWVQDPNLPLGWRREVVRLAGERGRDASLGVWLRQLRQDPALTQDADFALDALQERF